MALSKDDDHPGIAVGRLDHEAMRQARARRRFRLFGGLYAIILLLGAATLIYATVLGVENGNRAIAHGLSGERRDGPGVDGPPDALGGPVYDVPGERSDAEVEGGGVVDGAPGHDLYAQLSTSQSLVRPPSLPAWRRFAKPTPAVNGRPMVAVIIDDMVHSRPMLERILALDTALTLSFLPDAPHAANYAAIASDAGFEIMLHLPMEPRPRNAGPTPDPGPRAIRVAQSDAEVREQLSWNFGRIENYVGVNNHMGSLATADERIMTLVLEEVERRGLLFVNSRTGGSKVPERLARDMVVPAVTRDVFLDHGDETGAAAVSVQLAALEDKARERGYAVAIGHPRKGTVEALEGWLPTLEEKGLVVVPITTIVKAIRLD